MYTLYKPNKNIATFLNKCKHHCVRTKYLGTLKVLQANILTPIYFKAQQQQRKKKIKRHIEQIL